MTEAQLCKVEDTNEALDRPDRIVRPNIILDPCRKQTGLIPALAGLECMIRHEQNRTSTRENAEFLPSLVRAVLVILLQKSARVIPGQPQRVGALRRPMTGSGL